MNGRASGAGLRAHALPICGVFSWAPPGQWAVSEKTPTTGGLFYLRRARLARYGTLHPEMFDGRRRCDSGAPPPCRAKLR